jgi:hypothetical protein
VNLSAIGSSVSFPPVIFGSGVGVLSDRVDAPAFVDSSVMGGPKSPVTHSSLASRSLDCTILATDMTQIPARIAGPYANLAVIGMPDMPLLGAESGG